MRTSILAFLILVVGVLGRSAPAAPFRIIQLNTWGVPLLVEDCFRYRLAMEQIENASPDVVVLEEVFTGRGKRAFQSKSYPYEVLGPRAFPRLTSSGIRILSKLPVLRTARTAFRRCTGSDCLSKKGAVLAVLLLPDGQKLNLVATHLDSGEKVNVRLSQLQQIRDLVRVHGEADAPVIFAGDFNFGEDSIEYPRALALFEASDTYRALHPASDPGFTYDAYQNRYAHDYSIKTRTPLIRSRIDYLFARNGAASTVTPVSLEVSFDREPLVSDHYGLTAEFSIDPAASAGIHNAFIHSP